MPNQDKATYADNKAFQNAAEWGNIKKMKKLILAANVAWNFEEGLKLNLKELSFREGIDFFDYNQTLFRAINFRHLDVVRHLIEEGEINPNTTLNMRSSKNRKLMEDFIQEANAEISIVSAINVTPLMLAALIGSDSIVKYLIEKGANPLYKDAWGRTALTYAVAGGHLDLVKYFIEKGDDINAKEYGINLLTHSMSGKKNKKNNAVLPYLIEKGINIEARDINGLSALFVAIHLKNQKAFQYLLNHGANVNAQNTLKRTPLIEAVVHKEFKMVQTLIQNGADINIPTSRGNTPLIVAAENGDTKTIDLLVEHGADIDHQNEEGETALFQAARNGHFRVVRHLVKHGSDLYITDNYHKITAEQVAFSCLKLMTSLYLLHSRKNNLKNQKAMLAQLKRKIKTLPPHRLQNLDDNKYFLKNVIRYNQIDAVLDRLNYSHSVVFYNHVKTKVTPDKKKHIEALVRQKRQKEKC